MGVFSGPGTGCDGASGRHGVGMSEFVFKRPNLGEGTGGGEIVAWHTKPGDVVAEDQLIVEVMTDKAAVEVPAPVSGRVLSIGGAPGDKVAVGSPLIVFDVGGGAVENGAGQSPSAAPTPARSADATPAAAERPASGAVPAATRVPSATPAPLATSAPPARHGRVMASPANRRRARE